MVWKADKTSKFDITKKTTFGKTTELTCEVPEGVSVYVDRTGNGSDVHKYGPIYEKKTLEIDTLSGDTNLTYHKVTVDGVAQMVDAAAKKVTGLKKEGYYLVDGKYAVRADANGEYTFGSLPADRTMDSAGKVTDNANNCSGIATLVDSDYAKIGAEITLTLNGSVKIDNNGVVSYVTDGSTSKKITVNGDVTVTDWETVDDFNANVAAVIKGLKEAKPSDGTIDINGKNVTLTIKNSVPGNNNLGTIFVEAIEELLTDDDYTVKLHLPDGQTKNLLSEHVWTTLEKVLGTVLTNPGDEAEFTITIANAYDASDEYAVKVVNDVKD